MYDELGWDLLKTRRNIHKLILFYKIINGYSPQYLYDLIEPFLPSAHQYNLRTGALQFKIPNIRTTSYMESFFPSTVKQWNNLPDYIRNASSISSFKNMLKSYFCKKVNELYHFGERRYNVLHCQIRNKASNLNLDLYSQGLSVTPMCDNCNNFIEDAYHYFFICSKYATSRKILIHSIQSVTGADYQPEIDLLLYGSANYEFDSNIKIFKAVHTYIASTKRFV